MPIFRVWILRAAALQIDVMSGARPGWFFGEQGRRLERARPNEIEDRS